jgi:electron transfer flavoprotein alpha subunit
MGGKLQSKVKVKGAGTVLVSVQSGAFQADGATRGESEVKPLAVDLARVKPDREVLGYEEVGGDTVDLTKASIIVAVGRGVGGADKMAPVEALAKALGAEIGASRPVIDNGWLPRDRQIGSSGQTVAPKLYIAAGISGAIQHLVGMKGSTVIVAINKDPGAPIFTIADYGIVGDLHEVLPALTEAVRAAKG